MNQIDPALIQMLMQYGLLKAPQQPSLLGVSGKPITQGPNTTQMKKPVQTIGVRG